MKDLLDKLKDAGRDALGTFVELEDDEAPGDAARPAAPKGSAAPKGPAAPPAAPAAPVPAGVAPGTVDPEFVQQLHAAVQGSKKAAYTHFQTLFSALSAVADPAQRTQLALSACQASHGVTPQQVAEALDDRLALLAGERKAFDKAVADETEHTIGATQKRIEAAKAEIVKKTEEIRQLEATRAELEKGIAETRTAIDSNAARFAASYAVVEAELAAERARIAPFITPNPK